MTPTRSVDLTPPGRIGDTPGIRELIRKQAPEDERPAVALCVGDMAGFGDKLGETPVGDRNGFDLERIKLDLSHRALSIAGKPIRVIGAHQEAGACQLHPGRRESAMSLLRRAVVDRGGLDLRCGPASGAGWTAAGG